MNSLKNMIAGCGLIATMALTTGCDKELDPTIEENFDFTNTSNVQLYNAIVGSNRTFLYVDNKPVNGATIAYGAAFPSSAYGFTVTGANNNMLLRDTLASSSQVPLSFQPNLEAGKNYTIFAYDTSTAPQQLTVETNIVIPTDSTARLRFANFQYSTAARPAVDVFSVKRQANIFTNISKTQVTDFIPYASSLNDTLIVRETGTTNFVAQLNGINPTEKRSYTVVLRGGVSRVLTSFANR
ncbi:MAG: DUF4397 domain-containing protein [Chitinophagaceae bacterium]